MNNFFKILRETSFGRFFIPLGIILIAFGFVFLSSMNNTKNYIETEAVVSRTELFEEAYYDGETQHDATYTVFVKYTVGGKEYEEEFGIFSGMKVGEKVTISYNPENPSEISQKHGIVLPIACFVLGMVSLISGIISIVNAVKKQKKLKLQEEEWKNAN